MHRPWRGAAALLALALASVASSASAAVTADTGPARLPTATETYVLQHSPTRQLTALPRPNTAAGVESSPQWASLACDTFARTYAQIDADLALHRQMGVSWNATQYIAKRLGNVPMRGLTVG
jgi:hypothetical protein